MAKTNKNDITYGNTGKFGKRISFRSYGDETLMVSRPGKRTKALTASQVTHKLRFIQASRYGKRVRTNEALKSIYTPFATRKISFYALAIKDFLQPPTVQEIYVTHYKGNAGDKINVLAHDDFQITSLFLQIFDQQNTLVEEGWAVETTSNQEWEYTATTTQVLVNGYTVIATAYDLPGNKGVMEQELPA